MGDFKYDSNVSDEQFKFALANLERAIAKKDTPKEWLHFTAKTIFIVGKIAVATMGYGPALELLNHIFGDNKDIMKILEIVLKETNKNA